MDAQDDALEASRRTFLEEAKELLTELEDALLELNNDLLDQELDDRETAASVSNVLTQNN